ncbi:MAG: ferredoxin family protein [Planctomycetes bacterium]|nr:ferredoxin family protein [Planctomycetota bacterium]MCB9886731.1 ferredoxin family protein [Planctomycetota bacterium]
MTHVVAEPCVNCKFTDCVEVCPVDAFREGANCLVISPDDCIDCTLCVSQCPVGAIYIEGDLPEKWAEWLELNARLSRVWPAITKQKEPLAEHERWSTVEDKRAELSETPGEGD